MLTAVRTREMVSGCDLHVRVDSEVLDVWHLTLDRVLGGDGDVMSRAPFSLDGERMSGSCLFTTDDEGRVQPVEDSWPLPCMTSPDRAHLIEMKDCPDPQAAVCRPLGRADGIPDAA